MPQKAKFTREEIVLSAIGIVEESGAEALTARALGARLGSSARPIFTVFSGMDEVIKEVDAYAKAVYGEYVEEGLREALPFKGVGLAYIRFATEHPRLFQLLFMKEQTNRPDRSNVLRGIEEHYEAILLSIEKTYGVERNTADALYFHLWVYSHGIAVLTATKVCVFSAEQISQLLTEVFAALLKKIKSEGTL